MRFSISADRVERFTKINFECIGYEKRRGRCAELAVGGWSRIFEISVFTFKASARWPWIACAATTPRCTVQSFIYIVQQAETRGGRNRSRANRPRHAWHEKSLFTEKVEPSHPSDPASPDIYGAIVVFTHWKATHCFFIYNIVIDIVYARCSFSRDFFLLFALSIRVVVVITLLLEPASDRWGWRSGAELKIMENWFSSLIFHRLPFPLSSTVSRTTIDSRLFLFHFSAAKEKLFRNRRRGKTRARETLEMSAKVNELA